MFEVTVACAAPVAVASSCDVAVIVMLFGTGTGAVYNPELLMVPQVALEQPVPVTLHISTAASDFVVSSTDVAVTVTVTGEGNIAGAV